MPGAAEPEELAEIFADVARTLSAERDLTATLQKIASTAVATIDGCEHAGVWIVHRTGTIHSPAASDEVPRLIDAIQFAADQGPCLDAIREHGVQRTDDLGAEDRWARFSARAVAETGVRSILSFRLFVDDGVTLGALNLYAREPAAFDDLSRAIGAVFAAHAAIAMQHAQAEALVEQLQYAISTRATIEQAKGILMAAEHCTADEAFVLLVKASQRTNVKLRDVADAIVSNVEQRGG